MKRLASLWAMGLSVMVACGGAGAVAPSPTPMTSPAAAASSSAPASTSSAANAAPATSATPLATGAQVQAHVAMRPPIPSALGADLQALGVDPKNLPPIDKLDPKGLRGAMTLLARSLGAKCSDCHAEGDFAAPTRRKKIAAKMWNEFAAKLTTAEGSAVFCDSCHQGRIVQLDRTDKKALAKWMDANFVDGLKRKDGTAEECESCHVDMEMRFLAKWGQ
jgi:hypothetical protein